MKQLNQLAHQIAYSATRSDIECFTAAAFIGIAGRVVPAGPLEHRWYDLSTIIHDSFERGRVATAITYLTGRQLLQRHPAYPFLARIRDADSEETPVEGLRLEPMEAKRSITA